MNEVVHLIAVVWPADHAARVAYETILHACHIKHVIAIRLPLLEAAEAGLWLFCTTAPEVIAVPRPILRQLGGRPHCEDGLAVWWPDGARYYFWRSLVLRAHTSPV